MPGLDMPGSPKSEIKNSKSSTIQHFSYSITGNCGMYKTRIEKAARFVNGVTMAVWIMKTKKINMEYDATKSSVDVIQKAIAKAVHGTNKYKADDKVSNS